jgi:hypothetical protein
MGADGESFTIPGGGSFSGAFASGPRNGQTFTVSNTPELTGWIGEGATVLTLTATKPTVETITYSGPPLPNTFYCICHISEVMIRLLHGP